MSTAEARTSENGGQFDPPASARLPKLLVVLTLLVMVPACTSEWSEQEFQDLVEYCDNMIPSTPQQPDQQCDHTMQILRDDLDCPVATAYEFIDETAELNYAAARTILEIGCESATGATSLVPDD